VLTRSPGNLDTGL